jgi:tetratricopeptide (TPR) repeat protein
MLRRLVLLMLLLPLLASAAVLKEESLQRLLDQGRHEELEREARQTGGDQGLAAQLLARLARAGAGEFDALIELGEQCVQQFAQSAACHYALGSALGMEAQSGGMLRAMRLVGRVKDSLARAVELDPAMFEARSSLQLVYLLVPAIAGGSVDKAGQLERAVRDSQPEVARLLRARLAAHAKQWEQAEAELAAIRLGEQRSFQLEVLNAWAGLARHWMKQGQHARARARFEQLAQQLPLLAQPQYQLGRIAADERQHELALRHYERARGLGGAAQLPIDYRVGVAHMDLGDKERARQALQRFVQDKRATRNNLEDARKRLKELG